MIVIRYTLGVSYRVTIQRAASKALGRIEHRQRHRLEETITALGVDPRPHGCRKLSGAEGWRVRVGDYRIVYVIDDGVRVVDVRHVGHRRDIYREV